MTVGSQGLKARHAVLLASVMLVATLPGSGALAADAAPVLKAPAPAVGWEFYGDFEIGARAFIQRPPSGFGRAAPPNNWLTPKTTDSIAKFEEYGEVPRGLFVDHLYLGAATKNGLYAIDFWAKNIGYNNQSYYLDLAKIGTHYLSLGWDQTPHLISTSAKTIFGGVGSTRLTVDDALQTTLQANACGATTNGATPAGCAPATGAVARTNIENAINNAATSLTMATQRDKASLAYKYTPDSSWDFKVDVTSEHRTGTRPINVNFGFGFNGNPSNFNFIEAIQPMDDRTHNINAMLQYVGSTPWGKKWVSNLKYSGSFFDNDIKYFEAENPFCITCTLPAGANRGANLLRMPVQPSNMANAITFNNLVDLPWDSRYTSTTQYNMMRQDDPFITSPTTGLAVAALPAGSANAKIDTLLFNNTLNTNITKNLRSTLRYRYYDVDNRTPELLFTNYIVADSTLSNNPRRNLAIAYTKQNASAELNWKPMKGANVGAAYLWEQHDRTRRDANVTNEHTGRLFGDVDVWGGGKARGSVAYSQRRYDRYDHVAFVENIGLVSSENVDQMRKYDLANRDRIKVETFVDIPVNNFMTVTPTFGLRNDFYPTDVVSQLGVSKDDGWNTGIELSAKFSDRLRAMVSYNYEERRRTMAASGINAALIESNIWGSDIKQRYDTIIAAIDWKAIPNRLDFRVEYLMALGSEDNVTRPCTSAAAGCTGTGTGVITTQFPKESNIFQRFSVLARYFVDPDLVKRMGWNGEVVAKVRYTWERNHMENWAIDNLTPYIPTPDQTSDLTGGGRSIFLAGINPNYTAQFIAASVAFKW